jgi:prepilin-type N-terminal cleavage/methylation domain-containing protein
MPKLTNRRRRGGFTLIEMMFALAILAGGLLAMLMVQMQALQQGRYGRHTTDAMQVARDQMEFFMRLPWAAAGVQPTGWTAPAPIGLAVQNEAGAQTQQTFNVSWRISTAGFDPNVRVIEVSVTWTEDNVGANFPRSYLLASNKNNES